MNDYNKLLGRIKEFCGTNANYAKELGISEQSLYKKIYQGVPFKQGEIDKSIKLLHIRSNEIVPIFFTKKVEKN